MKMLVERDILPSDLFISESLRPSSNSLSVTVQLNWNKAFWVIGTNRAQNNEGLALLNLAKTESVIHADRCRSNIE